MAVVEGTHLSVGKSILRILLIALGVFLIIVLIDLLILDKKSEPRNWGNYNLLKDEPVKDGPKTYNGKQMSYDEYIKWVYWGEDWFRNETFGNEKLWTDIVGFLGKEIYVPKAGGSYDKVPFFKFLLEAIDDLDSVKGNLFSGNGGGYTNDLVVKFPPGCLLDSTFEIPQRLHTGLDVEAGSSWPIGVVPVKAPPEDESLPYLLDPEKYAEGTSGIGHMPVKAKFRVGVTCALCHYSLDVDWDGKPDLKSARPDVFTEGSPYKPWNAWAIGNQDISLGWILAMASNTIAGFENTGRAGGTSLSDAREWAKFVLDNYKTNRAAVQKEVVRGLLLFPRGFADDTPDGLHNPLQFPSLFTYMNWPYNYDGVMLNASDRNNNVWTTGLDLSQLVDLCSNRGGKSAKLLFWQEQGMYSVLKDTEYASIVSYWSPAAMDNPKKRQELVDNILGYSDGVPGVLDTGSIVLINGVPNAIPKKIFNDPRNKNRIRAPKQFGEDGKNRGAMVGLLGTRVITPESMKQQYKIYELANKYGINPDEFVTESVSMMLDWVEPPPNTTKLLENARIKGLVEKGYDIFKSEKCADCHAGPILTNNTIIPLETIKTDSARTKATAALQSFLAAGYDPSTGLAVSGGIISFLSKWLLGVKPGYKVVTLRYLWGSAPYLHDGGVGVTLSPQTASAGDDLQSLLQRPENEKVYGMGQILSYREKNPDSYLRPNAALSLQALLLETERNKVIQANKEPVWQIAASDKYVSMASIHIEGIGHDFYINDSPGGEKITALVAFLLALDNDPRK